MYFTPACSPIIIFEESSYFTTGWLKWYFSSSKVAMRFWKSWNMVFFSISLYKFSICLYKENLILKHPVVCFKLCFIAEKHRRPMLELLLLLGLPSCSVVCISTSIYVAWNGLEIPQELPASPWEILGHFIWFQFNSFSMHFCTFFMADSLKRGH